MPTTSQSVEETRARLASVGQEHLLRFVDELSEPQRAGLLAQIDALPLDELPRLIDTYVRAAAEPEPIGDVTPPSYYPYDAGERGHIWDRDAYTKRGEDLIRAGKIATFTVAGGQGSRLGHDGPKGTYKLGAITGKPLFQFFAEIVKASSDRYDVAIPWYIMTSPLNHEDTIAFFEANGFWGLPRGDVMFFPQGVMPSLDAQTGRILLTDKHMVATNPDGHGGSLTALHASGALDDMTKRGIEHISYFQVDNPNVKVADPLFLGLHAAAPDSSGELSSKML
ncbi:MAG: UTP--glucose-1-phosphate uridylyltransferase, partial [Planctomycetota bacterium]